MGEISMKPNKVIEFVYCSQKNIKWRKVSVIEDNSKYIGGFDLDDGDHYKLFKKKNILGGKVFMMKELEENA